MALIIDNKYYYSYIEPHTNCRALRIAGHINKVISILRNDCTDKLIGRQRVHDFSKIP